MMQVGIALGGGGAKGLAHLGALFAAGQSPDEIERIQPARRVTCF